MIICPTCGKETLHQDAFGNYSVGKPEYVDCAACRATQFARKCPPIYQDTDRAKLPSQLDQVLAWTPGPRGLILMGDTGKGKTRCAWELLRQYPKQRRYVAFDCVSFGHELSRKYRGDEAEDWLDSLGTEIPLIFFDDLGKLKLTERAETELFGVIERRCANKLPILATTNDTGNTLAERMSENRGPALVRRLREFCDVIQF